MTTPVPFFPGPNTYPSNFLFPTEGFGDIGPVDGLAYMQYELDGFQFGGNPATIATNYLVEKVDFGDSDLTNQDTPLPLEDGTVFGRDYKRGRTITFTMNIVTQGSALLALDGLAAAWDSPTVRQSAGAVSVLRWNRNGRATRVYGRARKFAPVAGSVDRGWIPVLCDFRTIDHLYYSDILLNDNVTLVPTASGGWVMPFRFPVTPSGTSGNTGAIQIGGTKPAWVTTTINGPIINPIVTAVGQWQYQIMTNLRAGEFIVVSPMPWARYARRNGTTSVRSLFTQESVRLNLMQLAPGGQELSLSGVDPTGTSSVTVEWREARTSF